MSTPAWSRCEAVECRMECGLTRLLASDGILIRALKAYRSTIVWIPKRVIDRPQRARKPRPEGSRSPISETSTPTLAVQSGHWRSFFPLPRILTNRSEEHTSELQSLRHLVC